MASKRFSVIKKSSFSEFTDDTQNQITRDSSLFQTQNIKSMNNLTDQIDPLFQFIESNNLVEIGYVTQKEFQKLKTQITPKSLAEFKEKLKKRLDEFALAKDAFLKTLFDAKEEKSNSFKEINRKLFGFYVLKNYFDQDTPRDTDCMLQQKYDVVESELNTFLKPLKCKICMGFVPIWLFLEHSNNCCNLYSNNKKILKINQDILDLCTEIGTIAGAINYFEIVSKQKSRLSDVQMNSDRILKFLQKEKSDNSKNTRRRNSEKVVLQIPKIIETNFKPRKSNVQKSVFSQYQNKACETTLAKIDNQQENENSSLEGSDDCSEVKRTCTDKNETKNNHSNSENDEINPFKLKYKGVKESQFKSIDKNSSDLESGSKTDKGTQVDIGRTFFDMDRSDIHSRAHKTLQCDSDQVGRTNNCHNCTSGRPTRGILAKSNSYCVDSNPGPFSPSKGEKPRTRKSHNMGERAELLPYNAMNRVNSVSIREESQNLSGRKTKRVSFENSPGKPNLISINKLQNSIAEFSGNDFKYEFDTYSQLPGFSKQTKDNNQTQHQHDSLEPQLKKFESNNVINFQNSKKNLDRVDSNQMTKTASLEQSDNITGNKRCHSVPVKSLKYFSNPGLSKRHSNNEKKTWFKEINKVFQKNDDGVEISNDPKTDREGEIPFIFESDNPKLQANGDFELSVDKFGESENGNSIFKMNSEGMTYDPSHRMFETFGFGQSLGDMSFGHSKTAGYESERRNDTDPKTRGYSQFKNHIHDDEERDDPFVDSPALDLLKTPSSAHFYSINEQKNDIDRTRNETLFYSHEPKIYVTEHQVEQEDYFKANTFDDPYAPRETADFAHLLSPPTLPCPRRKSKHLYVQNSLEAFMSTSNARLSNRKSCESKKLLSCITSGPLSKLCEPAEDKSKDCSDSRSELIIRYSTNSVISADIMLNLNPEKDQKVFDDCLSVHEQIYDENRNKDHLKDRKKIRMSILKEMKSNSKRSREIFKQDNYDEYNMFMLNKEVKKYKESLLANPFLENFFNDQKLLNLAQDFHTKFQSQKYKEIVKRLIDSLSQRIKMLTTNKKLQSHIDKVDNFMNGRKTRKEFVSMSCCQFGSDERFMESDIIKECRRIRLEKSEREKNVRQSQAGVQELQECALNFSNLIPMSKNISFKMTQNSKFAETGDKNNSLLVMKEAIQETESQNKLNDSENGQLSKNTCTEISPEKAVKSILRYKCASDSEFLDVFQREMMYQERVKEIGLSDFTILKQLGKGAYGKVYLVSRKNTSDVYAMKVIKFSGSVSASMLKSLQNEISIMNVLNGEFLVQAYFSFVEQQSLYIIMEYLYGGDFRNLLETEGRLDNNTAQWYTAELILAIIQLHSKGIIHRDLKPENILLDQNGRLKLADFGLSEFKDKIDGYCLRNEELSDAEINSTSDKNKSSNKIVGTPDYIAPELILGYKKSIENILTKIVDNKSTSLEDLNNLASNNPETTSKKSLNDDIDAVSHEHKDESVEDDVMYSKTTIRDRRKNFFHEIKNLKKMDQISTAIDWWAVGCLLYEFLVGVSPFGGMTVDEIYDNIVNLRIEWPNIGYGPDDVTPEAQDLIKKLLDPNPRNRFGTYGPSEIITHPFFNNLDWSRLGTDKPPITISEKPVLGNSMVKMSGFMDQKHEQREDLRVTSDDFAINRVDLLYDMNIKCFLSQRFDN